VRRMPALTYSATIWMGSATIRVASQCRGVMMIAAKVVARKRFVEL
jgi:hypothetical protein